jgi:hypothetical protein
VKRAFSSAYLGLTVTCIVNARQWNSITEGQRNSIEALHKLNSGSFQWKALMYAQRYGQKLSKIIATL